MLLLLLCCCNPLFQIFRRGLDRPSDLSWEALKQEVTLAVEAEVGDAETFRPSDQRSHANVLIPALLLLSSRTV